MGFNVNAGGAAGGLQQNFDLGKMDLGKLDLDKLGLDAKGGAGAAEAMKLLQKLAEMLGIDPQSGAGGKQVSGQAGGGPKGASGAGGAKGGGGSSGAGGMSIQDLLKQLKKLAQENPQALQQALGQVPGLAQAISSVALGAGGAGGGAAAGGGSVGG